MIKSISISLEKWDLLKERLKKDYNPNILLIRDRTREVLGFVERTHRFFDGNSYWTHKIYLDFYNEQKKTMFILRYSEYLSKDDS